MKSSLPLAKVYGFLETGPVVMVTTAGDAHPNIMTMSWHMMVEFEPPIIACVISNRNYSFDLLMRAKECVINIPTVDLVEKVVACGNHSGKTIDKFAAFNLTPAAASIVKAPLIDECYVNLECKVIDITMVATYNLFLFEAVKAWIDRKHKDPRTIHHRGNGQFMVAGETITLPSKMK